MDTGFVIDKRGEEIARLPVLFAIIATVVAPWLMILSAVVALCCGCTVHMETPVRARVYSRPRDDGWREL